jgi:hypothetical protein
VALSHAGWVALELRRKLGAERIPAVVLLDWMPLGTPSGFAGALQALQDPQEWSATRAQLFGLWSAGVDSPDVLRYVDSMSAYGFPMWSRAGREILRSFAAQPTPLAEFAALAATGHHARRHTCTRNRAMTRTCPLSKPSRPSTGGFTFNACTRTATSRAWKSRRKLPRP